MRPQKSRPTIKAFRAILIVILPEVTLSLGCSLVGLGIGAVIDAGADEPELVSIGISGLELHQEITILLRDGSTMRGSYEGIDTTPLATYAELFDDAAPPAIGLPRPGDPVVVAVRDLRDPDKALSYSGLMAGYGVSRIFVRKEETAPTDRIALDRIISITDGDSVVTPGDDLRFLISAGTVPLADYILLRVDGTVARVSLHRVSAFGVGVEGGGHAKWVGLAVGAAIDAVAVVLIVNDAKNETARACGAR